MGLLKSQGMGQTPNSPVVFNVCRPQHPQLQDKETTATMKIRQVFSSCRSEAVEQPSSRAATSWH